MTRYKRVLGTDLIQKILDNNTTSYIPPSEDNTDYQEFLKWSETNTVEPADPAPPPDPQVVADGTDRDNFLAAVDAAITAVSNNGWDGLTANNRKQIMLNLLKFSKVVAKRI